MDTYSSPPPPVAGGTFNKERLQGLTQVKKKKKKKKLRLFKRSVYLLLKVLIKRVQFLQAQGAIEDTNLEYAQIMQLLKNIQRQQPRQIPDLRQMSSMSDFPSGPPPIPYPTPLSSGNIYLESK
jgi:ATP-dependent helicase STH1/SNF2